MIFFITDVVATFKFIPDDTGTSLKVDHVKQKAPRFLNELRFEERRTSPVSVSGSHIRIRNLLDPEPKNQGRGKI
jgi:hypothetical protein